MPSYVKPVRRWLLAWLLIPLAVAAGPYQAVIDALRLSDAGDAYALDAKIVYTLSPSAKEALHKGVPLAWEIRVELRQIGRVWDDTVLRRAIPFSIQFHALLNQYSVKRDDGAVEMFSTLTAAFAYMSSLQDDVRIAKAQLDPQRTYRLAIRTQFDREFLPIPLRPMAYLDAQWFLSSDWRLWPLQK